MSKYIELYEDIKNKILNGEYKHGEKIPGELELMRDYGYSRVTVIAAMKKLKERNYIVRKQGDGSYVNYQTCESNNEKRTVALIVQNANTFSNLIIAMRMVFDRYNISLSVYSSHLYNQKEIDIIKKLQATKIDGIICYPNLLENNYYIWNDYIQNNFPIIFLDRYPSGMPCTSILDDGYRNMYNITNYAISKGHKNIAYFTLPTQVGPVMQDRYNGFISAMASHNLKIPPNGLSILPYSNSHYTENDLLPNIMMLLSNIKDFSLIICSNGTLANQFSKVAKMCGFKIPEDISLIGHDDCELTELCTTIQNYHAIGKEAANLMVNRLIHSNNAVHKVYVQGIFHEGSTLKDLNDQ